MSTATSRTANVETHLKTRLEEIAAAGYAVPDGVRPAELAETMLAHLGSPDPELRDRLIYTTFARWISNRVFSPAELRRILHAAIDPEHLFYCIGETGTGSVFTRSFSALLLPPILIAHREGPFLTREDVFSVKVALLRYLAEEKDLRGHTGETGWAHAAAHVADALDDLAQCPEFGKDDLSELLTAIAPLTATGEVFYAHNESARQAFAVASLLNRRLLPAEEVQAWIQSYLPFLQAPRGTLPGFARALNARNFLRALYFQGLRKTNGLEAEILQTIMETLDQSTLL